MNKNTVIDGVEFASNCLLKLILVACAVIILCLVILPSFAFCLGILYYAKEMLMVVFGIIGDIIDIFTI